MSNEINVKTSNEVALVDQNWLESLSGVGTNDIPTTEIRLPYLKIVQSNGKVLQENSPIYMEKAKSGMFYILLSQQLFDGKKGIDVVIVNMEKTLIEYDNDKKFVADHSKNRKILLKSKWCSEKRFNILENGNLLSDNYQFLLYILNDDGSYQPVLYKFGGTSNLEARRVYNTIIQEVYKGSDGQMKNRASFYYVFTIKTMPESKEIKNQMQYWNTITYTKKCKTEDIKNGAEILMSSYKLWLSYREGATIKNDTLDESEEFDDAVASQPEIKKADPKNLF